MPAIAQNGAHFASDEIVPHQQSGTADISAWPHNASSGYLRLWFGNTKDALMDDFGGGTILLFC